MDDLQKELNGFVSEYGMETVLKVLRAVKYTLSTPMELPSMIVPLNIDVQKVPYAPQTYGMGMTDMDENPRMYAGMVVAREVINGVKQFASSSYPRLIEEFNRMYGPGRLQIDGNDLLWLVDRRWGSGLKLVGDVISDTPHEVGGES